MTKRIYTVIMLSAVLGLVATAWARTSHKDFAEMKLKDCEECHAGEGVTQNHGEFWVKEHRIYAAKEPNNCRDCHEQSFCLDCHKGGGIDRDLHVSNSGADYTPLSHRTDFKELHPLKAKESPRSCESCHDKQKFCNDCHSKYAAPDLMTLSHRRQFRDIPLSAIGPTHASFTQADCQNCHAGGVLPKHEWSQDHAREARKNLSSCQTCHPDGDVCMKCHSAQAGLRISPHPRNWSRISGRLGSASNNRTCQKCH
ncbi:MAG: hypothetical protein M0024_01605 [Nitrospiraceae bacterium]|nr:hypothetical protein [Nitrospiraceae bacterium]